MEKKQITLRIDNELYEALVKISKERKVNIHQLILNIICDFIFRNY